MTGGYSEADRQESRMELRALAQRVETLVTKMEVMSYKLDEQKKDIEESTKTIGELSRKITAIELASAKPLWMSAGIASAALVIGWLMNAWEGLGKVFHK